MPAVPPTLPVTATARRSFLARTTGLGALATLGAVASPAGNLVTAAGAQSSSDDEYTDSDFAAFTAPLELAAVQAYQAALSYDALSGDAKDAAELGRRHHQEVADTLITLLDADAPAPQPASEFADPIVSAISATSDQPTVLRALVEVEETISATHLQALESIPDTTTAKVVAQVLTIEAQQGTYLALLAGDDAATLTPTVASTAEALKPGDVEGAPPTETTTTSSDTTGN